MVSVILSPVEILLETAWQAILDIPVLSVGTTGSLPRLANCGRYLAEDNVGQWHYINHAGEWQTCPPPSAGTGTSGWDWSVDAVDVLPFSLSDLERNATAQMGEARGALAIALSAIEKAGDDLQASGAYPVGALAALIVPAEQVRTAITNIDRALSSKHLPPNAAGLKLYRYDSKDRLIGCESVLFVDGFPAVETTLRRARIAGRAEVGGDIDKHFADVLDKDGDWIGASVALDRASYSALKNRWMRCKTEDLDNVLGRRTRSKQRSDKE